MSYSQKDNTIYDNVHRQYEFKKQSILADESLTEDEKSEAIKMITVAYDKDKIALNELIQSKENNSLEKNNSVDYTSNDDPFTSRLHQFENFPEQSNSTEEEQEAFHSNTCDFHIPEMDSNLKDIQIGSNRKTMMQQLIKKNLAVDVPSLDKIKILLLGETGVGKTTFINAFANYIKFETLKDAKSGDMEILIPSKFTITDENYINRTIKIGKDDSNEQFESLGASSTLECRSHILHTKNKRIELIDTPGIGDTRGLDQDKKNFENILNFINNFKFLNGICILLKPNNSRLNVIFRFYIQELLSNLHQSAKDNIVFCFTNSRGTFYRPGDTLPPLKKQLEGFSKRSNVEIKANKDTMYCFDNESFRFLAAMKDGITFTDADEQSFAESWDKSANESSRLIEYIITRPPHKVKHTLSLNYSRNTVTLLSKPLAEIERLIQINIKLIKEKQKELVDISQITEKLKDKLNFLQLELEPLALKYPRTVCTNNKCIKILEIEQTNIKTIDYTTHCCSCCQLTNIRSDETNNTALRSCSAMVAGECKFCGCYRNEHIYITYENKINVKVKKPIMKTKKAIIEKCQKRIDKLQEEQRKINEISLKFAQFLRQNAIYSSCDAYVDYLNHFIKEERIKKGSNDDGEIINELVITKGNYLEKIEVIKQAIENKSSPQISPKDIVELEQQLYNLKRNGSALKKMKDEAERNQTNAFKNNKKHMPNFIRRNKIKFKHIQK